MHRQCSDELIEAKRVLSLVPSPFTTEMIASEMPAAINPYSMAVAADSSAQNFIQMFFIVTVLPNAEPNSSKSVSQGACQSAL
jgi:hypothetical protein